VFRFHVRIPKLGGSTLQSGPGPSHSVLDGSDVIVRNRWQLPAHTVALIGRPALYFAIDIKTPRLALGPLVIPALHKRWEQDFGGHLFVAIAGADASHVVILEGGPTDADGSGALVPFAYPEDSIADEGLIDFPPIVISPPNGLTQEAFAKLVHSAQRTYDGNQRYVPVEVPFLFVGRDSNSYATSLLLCAGVSSRGLPEPRETVRFEWLGYPGMKDPVHLSNFGTYLGAPTKLASGAVDVAYHNQDGSVRFVIVGGEPGGRAGLPDGTDVALDERGRAVFSPEDAAQHKLPSAQTAPPEHIRTRRFFPPDPAAAGGFATLVVNGKSEPLLPGTAYRGTIVERDDALCYATLQTETSTVILPTGELGVELRDPKRVNELLQVGNELTVGLDRDRYPKLVAHGANSVSDRLTPRRLHAPRRMDAIAGALALVVVLGGALLWRRNAAR
jgi:hypothetical protein